MRAKNVNFLPRPPRPALAAWLGLLGLLAGGGCWAPLVSHDIPAAMLSDEFRMPCRTAGPELNLCHLTIPPQPDYILGPDDVLEVIVHGLYSDGEIQPLRAQLMASGEVHLPLVGAVRVGGMNLLKAQMAITDAYANGFINDPRVNVSLVERSMTTVVVLGEVEAPGVYKLPKYENDVAHALASAGGLKPDAGLEVEVHRRASPHEAQRANLVEMIPGPGSGSVMEWECFPPEMEGDPMRIIRIPLRGFMPEPLYPQDVVLLAGDVVTVPSRKDEVFYVVGKLNPSNFVRFSLNERDRDIGAGFLLPRDREVDVVTAVAMAGYIDPIDSPTTVTVHRIGPNGEPLLVRVDLIKARYDRRETILVAPGDIIYLNPDICWWGRRTFDRILPDMFGLSYRRLLGLGGN